ncbi:hypothetical protein [Alteromonas sp. W364]|jgi:hypothetical protein|uniref:hypothetical protein n=1 Tax=Alteromonas sp. W364 TaxID=3075610 RepID=UPI0028847B99|nr:hypothetical protein [Alteromonas sp. W364]MDT0628703.1 hypothetical protein [Alteromonas sp. W364]
MKANDTKQNNQLVKFAAYIAITIFTLVFGYFKSVENNEKVNEEFSEQLFDLEGVTTRTVYFSNSTPNAEIKFESSGLPNRADSYKPEILAYVCSQPVLQKELNNGKVVVFNMSAWDREDGNFVNMRIDAERCRNASADPAH